MTERLPENILYDKRLIERHITRGLITREDVDKRLAAIEDLTEQADITPIDEIMGIVQPAAKADDESSDEG